jgi:hypothetical protein
VAASLKTTGYSQDPHHTTPSSERRPDGADPRRHSGQARQRRPKELRPLPSLCMPGVQNKRSLCDGRDANAPPLRARGEDAGYSTSSSTSSARENVEWVERKHDRFRRSYHTVVKRTQAHHRRTTP